MKHVDIAIASSSVIVTTGLAAILAKLRNIHVTVKEIDPERIDEQLNKLKPLILIVDPLTIDAQKVKELKSTSPSRMFIIAVYNTALPVGTVRVYDKTISIYDSIDTITATLSQLLEEESDEGQKVLSQREKDVVTGIVKGLSNKEIATEMNVSVNTVMTHRRNIASKLQIHSPASLTIYAIVSKLVKLDEIKSQLPI